MKKTKKIVGLVSVVLAISLLSIGAFAAVEYSSGVEVLADLTDQTQEDIYEQRQAEDLTCGEIAESNGVFEEFREEMSTIREANRQRVAEHKSGLGNGQQKRMGRNIG